MLELWTYSNGLRASARKHSLVTWDPGLIYCVSKTGYVLLAVTMIEFRSTYNSIAVMIGTAAHARRVSRRLARRRA